MDPRVEAAHAGDPIALEAILIEQLPRMRAQMARVLGPSADLEDALQDALIALADALPTFEGRSKLETFAYRIALRTAWRHLRRRSRHAPLELVPPPPDMIDPESRAIDREVLRRLYGCLGKISRKRRAAFVLCAIEGLDAEEAAEIAETTAVAIRLRLMHARREIARLMRHDPYVQRLLENGESRKGGPT